jgi:PAP2 superfamily
MPQWGTLPPFTLHNAAQFRPGAPYLTKSKRYTEDFNEVKSLGGDGITTPSARTPDQTEIARFWVENSLVQWNRIARTVSASAGLNLWENARLFGLLNFALTDGYIASFDTKYHYNFWRPITAIREAATDGNPNTIADPTWTPLEITPPIPDYDSAHSVAGGTAAEVLKQFFGTDTVGFSTCSTSLPAGSNCNDPSPVIRSYATFSQAAEENGLSRILVGFHFRKAVTAGIEHGRKIADHAVRVYLRPVH